MLAIASKVIALARYDAWRGVEVIGDWFILRRGDRQARCEIRTHPLGWELRLIGGARDGFEPSQVCRTEPEVLDLGDQWKAKDDREGVELKAMAKDRKLIAVPGVLLWRRGRLEQLLDRIHEAGRKERSARQACARSAGSANARLVHVGRKEDEMLEARIAAGVQRSPGERPVRFATRASIFGPISSPS